jgi:hypothetical protein
VPILVSTHNSTYDKLPQLIPMRTGGRQKRLGECLSCKVVDLETVLQLSPVPVFLHHPVCFAMVSLVFISHVICYYAYYYLLFLISYYYFFCKRPWPFKADASRPTKQLYIGLKITDDAQKNPMDEQTIRGKHL